MDAILAAIMASFVTYLFTRGAEISNKIYDRQQRNFKALVRLEYLCCQNMDNIRHAIWIIDDFDNTVGKPVERGELVVYGKKLHLLPLDETIILDLLSTEVMNKLLAYKVYLGRLNNDMSNINEMYGTFKSALISKTIDPETYRKNTLDAVEKCKQLKGLLEHIDETNMELCAYSRVLSKESKPFLTHIINLFWRDKAKSASFRQKVSGEIEKLKKEQQETAKDSKNQIDNILKQK